MVEVFLKLQVYLLTLDFFHWRLIRIWICRKGTDDLGVTLIGMTGRHAEAWIAGSPKVLRGVFLVLEHKMQIVYRRLLVEL